MCKSLQSVLEKARGQDGDGQPRYPTVRETVHGGGRAVSTDIPNMTGVTPYN